LANGNACHPLCKTKASCHFFAIGEGEKRHLVGRELTIMKGAYWETQSCISNEPSEPDAPTFINVFHAKAVQALVSSSEMDHWNDNSAVWTL
jgi:hypothetical protein